MIKVECVVVKFNFDNKNGRRAFIDPTAADPIWARDRTPILKWHDCPAAVPERLSRRVARRASCIADVLPDIDLASKDHPC